MSVSERARRRVTGGLVVALVAALSAAGCGGSSAKTPNQDSKAPIEVWVRKPPGGPTEKTSKDLAAKFNENFKKYEVGTAEAIRKAGPKQ